jgi:hypothetical protein
MNKTYAYLKVFDILDQYWDKNKNEDLGNMLSDMNPNPLYETAYLTADPAVFAEWNVQWGKIVGASNDASNEQIYHVAEPLLDYYTNQLGYDIGDASSYLARRLRVYKRVMNKAA